VSYFRKPRRAGQPRLKSSSPLLWDGVGGHAIQTRLVCLAAGGYAPRGSSLARALALCVPFLGASFCFSRYSFDVVREIIVAFFAQLLNVVVREFTEVVSGRKRSLSWPR